MRIIGYARLSKASDESTSIARQRRIIERTCEARSWALVELHEDVDVSATKTRLDRPGLNAARASIARGGADGLMVWRLDRLCRSVGDFVTLLDEGLDIVSATEPIDTTTPMGRAMAQVLQVFAELESRTTGLRIRSARRYLVEEGFYTGGNVPYGYRVIPEGAHKVLGVDPAEAATVRRAAELVLAGHSVYRVAKMLTEAGMLPRRAPHWPPKSLQRILTSPATLGRLVEGDDVRRGPDGLPLQPWPPVLDLDTFSRLGAEIASRAKGRRQHPPNDAKRLLCGYLRCSGCGRRMTLRRRRTGAGRDVYACPASAHGGACDVGAVVECHRAEDEIEGRFLRLFGAFEVHEIVERSTTDEQAALLDEAIKDTAAAMTQPGADLDALVPRLTELKARQAALLAAGPTIVEEEVGTGETFAERWAVEGLPWKRRMLAWAQLDAEVMPAQRGRWRPERIRAAVRGSALV